MSDENRIGTAEQIEIEDAAPIDNGLSDEDKTTRYLAAGIEDETVKPSAPEIKDEIKHAPGKPLGQFEKLREGELEKLDGSGRRSG